MNMKKKPHVSIDIALETHTKYQQKQNHFTH